MKDRAIITVPSHPKYLSLVRDVTARMGDLFGMTESETEDVKLAVDEACSNVIKHAYRGDIGKKIVLKIRLAKKRFEVTIEDNGLKADEESIKGRNLEDVRPGGLGTHLIKKAFQVYAFDLRKKKGNRLKLIKYRSENGDKGINS